MSTWNSETDYLYTDGLNKEQWAWEFLRRNPDYQSDYQWFITQWRALEQEYGVPPDNDLQAWKNDTRSYKIIDIDSAQDGNCAISQDKLLIECWMGYKWGFYQFPPDPISTAPDISTTWRPLTPDKYQLTKEQCQSPSGLLSEHDKAELYMNTLFDLSRPLKEQLEMVKKQVIIAQRRLKKQGRLEPYTIAGKQALWCLCLRLLDAEQDNICETEIQFYFNKEKPSYDLEVIQNEAHHFITHYLDILTFMEK